MNRDWRVDLKRWLAPFVAALRHETRARMCPAYVAGLIGPGDRKSIQPMAARAAGVNDDQLHHFIASGAWNTAPLEAALLHEADRQVGGNDAWLIVDDNRAAQEGASPGRRGAAICLGTRQERQLPDAGVADTGFGRSAGHGGVTAIPARELDVRSRSARSCRRARGSSRPQDHARDRPGRD